MPQNTKDSKCGKNQSVKDTAANGAPQEQADGRGLQRDQTKKTGSSQYGTALLSYKRALFSAARLQTALQQLQAAIGYIAAAIAGSKNEGRSGHQQRAC